ncbi:MULTISPECIES: NHL repeat-containing protein [Marinobacter]|jgi:DNA-binding beta-propeller fold protein YncE|uniref:NHL repeat-containing protein n=1 Tax=Marinobacter TaxID=2742 RepID=UPI000FCA13E7|nr:MULTISPECIES: NHL repeat-containing protein [Marinobacter]MDM8181541.1 NHL repeat-containing protein [Marinobacter salarius]RUT74259.1 6-bladed beta-propeller [Marinobacter sp. NP-6]
MRNVGKWLTYSTLGLVAALTLLGCAGGAINWNQEPPYSLTLAWGEKGSAPGQFNDPTGIAVTDTEVFISDARNGRIQVFDHQGHFKREFGAPGDGIGELGRPMNLTIHNDKLYVPEYMNDRIQVFSLTGEPLRIIGSPGKGPGQFNAPAGVAVANDGDLFVADFYNHRVQHLNADGSFVKQWGTTGKTGRSAGEFTYPTDVALGKDGALYVADGYGNRVQVFDAGGDFLHKWGGPFALGLYGPFKGWFTTATSIAIGPEDNAFVADFYNDRIQKFAADGGYLTAFGSEPENPGHTAMAVAVGNDGAVWSVNFTDNRVGRWQPD